MKFISEKNEKNKKPYKLPFQSPVTPAWITYGTLTFLGILFALPVGAIDRNTIFPKLIMLGIILIIAVAVASAVASLYVMKHSKNPERINFAFNLILISSVADILSVAGGFLIGRNPETAYLVQILVLVFNAIITVYLYKKFKKQLKTTKLREAKVRKLPEPLPDNVKVITKFIVFPILAIFVIYALLMLATILSGNF